MALGERVRQLREERFLMPSELAERAGISRNTLYRIESGQYSAFPKTVRKLAEALRVQPTDLVSMQELRAARGARRPREVTTRPAAAATAIAARRWRGHSAVTPGE